MSDTNREQNRPFHPSQQKPERRGYWNEKRFTKMQTQKKAWSGLGLALAALLSAGCNHQSTVAPSPKTASPVASPITSVASPTAFQPYTIINTPAPKPAVVRHSHRVLRLTHHDGQYLLADSDGHSYRVGRDAHGHLCPVYTDPNTHAVLPLYYDSYRDRYYRMVKDDGRYYRVYVGDADNRFYADDRYHGGYDTGQALRPEIMSTYGSNQHLSHHGSHQDAWLIAIPVVIGTYLLLQSHHHSAPPPINTVILRPHGPTRGRQPMHVPVVKHPTNPPTKIVNSHKPSGTSPRSRQSHPPMPVIRTTRVPKPQRPVIVMPKRPAVLYPPHPVTVRPRPIPPIHSNHPSAPPHRLIAKPVRQGLLIHPTAPPRPRSVVPSHPLKRSSIRSAQHIVPLTPHPAAHVMHRPAALSRPMLHPHPQAIVISKPPKRFVSPPVTRTERRKAARPTPRREPRPRPATVHIVRVTPRPVIHAVARQQTPHLHAAPHTPNRPRPISPPRTPAPAARPKSSAPPPPKKQ
jgi:hypothetical protein